MTVTTAGEGKPSPASRSRSRNPAPRSEGRSGESTGHRRAAEQAIDANTTHLNIDLGPAHVHLTLPPLDRMAFYAGLAGAAALGVVEWPIAVVTGIGHALSDNRHHRTVRALGEALDAV